MQPGASRGKKDVIENQPRRSERSQVQIYRSSYGILFFAPKVGEQMAADFGGDEGPVILGAED
jgi:hypothetical protein